MVRPFIFLIYTVLFLIVFLESSNIYQTYLISEANTEIMVNRPINQYLMIYESITDVIHIQQYIRNGTIRQIYDISVKDERMQHPETQHPIATFNYFMGMRMTFNKADMIDNSDVYKDEIKEHRATDYDERPNKTLKKTKTDPFGKINQIPYSSSGGYAGKGGYVAFFQDNWNHTEADDYYTSLINDGLFEPDLVSLTLEIITYNQNYQLGINLAFEFMINNAGNIEKNLYKSAFFYSRYNKEFNQISGEYKSFLIFIDVLFTLGTIIYIYHICKRMYNRIHGAILLRNYNFTIEEVIDM